MKTPTNTMKEVARIIGIIGKTYSDLKSEAPLHVAAWSGNLEVFQYLFENSFDRNPKSYKGSTPFHWSVMRGHSKICRFLLEKKS